MPKPPIGFDMDGVICTPFLGSNIAISRNLGLAPLPDAQTVREFASETSRRNYQRMRRRFEYLRYLGRRPLSGVREGLEEIAELRDPVLITGRSWFAHHLIERWLDRYDLAHYFSRVLPNNTNLATAHYKLWTARRLGISEHIDDDGSISYYLAGHGLRVYLRDWPRNRGLPYPGNVKVYHRLSEVAKDLAGRLPMEEPPD